MCTYNMYGCIDMYIIYVYAQDSKNTHTSCEYVCVYSWAYGDKGVVSW